MKELKEFLHQVHPFDFLDEKTLNLIAAHTDIGYYKEGATLMNYSDSPQTFYVILKGIVKEINSDEEIVDIYYEKDCFDAKALLSQKVHNRFVADQETIVYEIGKEAFLEAINTSKEFKNYLLLGISHKLEKIKEQNQTKIIGEFLSAKISDTILNPPHLLPGDTTIYEAIKTLENTNSQILIIKKSDANYLYGVFTDKDLRKVILIGVAKDEHIEKIANFPAITIEYDDFLFNALLKMTNLGIKHLVVTQEENIIGTLEITEILSYFSNQTYLLAKNIENAQTIQELQKVSQRFFDVVKILYHKGIKIRHLAKLLDELHKKLYKKVFALTFDEETRKLSTLVVLGSEGRGEQLLRTDQDNALILDDSLEYAKLQETTTNFTNALIALGYPKCPGNIMLSNPYWCKSETAFKESILDWIENPNEKHLMYLSIFLDTKAIDGDEKRLRSLKNILYDRVSDNISYLANLAKPIFSFDTPLGLFNTLRTDKSNRIDLKKGGIFPIVHGSRILALQYRIEETNTVKRIKEINKLNILDTEFAKDLVEAYDTLQSFRLKASLESIEKGGAATNEIQIDSLSKIERDLLKDSFKIVDKFKSFIKYHYRLDMVI